MMAGMGRFTGPAPELTGAVGFTADGDFNADCAELFAERAEDFLEMFAFSEGDSADGARSEATVAAGALVVSSFFSGAASSF